MQSHQDNAKRVSEMSGLANNSAVSQHSSIPAEDWVAPIYIHHPEAYLIGFFIVNLG